MSDRRTHDVTTTDGVTISGTVHGHGPSLVLLHGILGDGDLDWRPLAEHLSDRFTCYLPSERGRGLSEDHQDLSLRRRVEDVLAYIDSLEAPTGLVGWSAGGAIALVAAARSQAVQAVAVYEPVIDGLMDEEERAAIGRALARMGELMAAGDLTSAARAFGDFVFNDQEIAVVEDSGYFEAAGHYAPNLLRAFQQAGPQDDPGSADPVRPDPTVLAKVSIPVVVARGAESKPLWARCARHVVDHLPDARQRDVLGAGHAGPLTHHAMLAETLVEFMSPAT